MFKTETHLHVSEISPCSKLTAREMIELYAKEGYSTVFVSDHLKSRFYDNFPELTLKEKVDKFFYGYDEAKKAGDELGVNVLISAELTYDHSPNHYLLYGFDKSFFYDLPNLFTMPKEEFYRYAKSKGVTVVQAHPYRDGKNTPDDPDIIDAVEAYNSNPRHDNFTEDCFAYASANGLPVTGGSDAHRLEDVARGGVITDVEITTAEQYVEALLSGSLEIIK
jgi:predicted metal-dependent phosphoesterase TrpH